MTVSYSIEDCAEALIYASQVLTTRKDEVNKLNVFPVPDGDTGTNMSLTLESVARAITELTDKGDAETLRKTITNGALMGARGNSGVITSQIMRGMCTGLAGCDVIDVKAIAAAALQAKETAFLAVRKPVRGTILTVMEDIARIAVKTAKHCNDVDQLLEAMAKEGFESVERTPDFLPTLKENGVVDSGGFGLAIIMDAIAASLTGKEKSTIVFDVAKAPKVEIEQIDDWEGSKYRYCNEFLVDSDTLVPDEALKFLATMGDCELCVGATPKFKVHVHSNTPDKVLAYFLERGQISEVFIHNMQLQSEQRIAKLVEERKNIAVVAVASGSGNKEILKEMGVDIVIDGGQTSNPSTADIVNAVKNANADEVVILPNNKNIIMAAMAVDEVVDEKCFVVPTVSVPQGISAMLGYNPKASGVENADTMANAGADTVTAEITHAVRQSKTVSGTPIDEGDVIGILAGKVVAVANDIATVMLELVNMVELEEYGVITLYPGEGMTNSQVEVLIELLKPFEDEVDVTYQRGDQPVYDLVIAID